MTNTPQLKHWSVDMLTNTQHRAHTERLETRIDDLEKRVEDLERAFYEKVDHPGIDWPEIHPTRLITK